MRVVCRGAAGTEKFGAFLAGFLQPGDLVALEAPLGGGKTTLTRGICVGLGIEPDEISSPTFVLMQIYEGKLPVYHFDLYRLQGPEELHPIGAEDYFWGDGVSLVEWPAVGSTLFPPDRLEIKLAYAEGEDEARTLSLTGLGKWEKRLQAFELAAGEQHFGA